VVLRPLHAAVCDAMVGSGRHPIAEPTPAARRAARDFLVAWREYLGALVLNLRAGPSPLIPVTICSYRVPVYPYTLAASFSLTWPLVP
jgi:hypothetical protein